MLVAIAFYSFFKLKQMIKIEKINKIYDNNLVLNNVSFFIRKGTIHALCGPNGAGKTTIIKIIHRLVLPDSGKIYVDNKNITCDPSYNEELGIIFSECIFSKYVKSVKNYILHCAYLRDISKQDALKKLFALDLKKYENFSPFELSTGWQKFLNFFILNLYKPKILLLDEALTGLDPIFRDILIDEIQKFRQNGGTVLISTHILEDLERLKVDFVTFINNGEIIFNEKKPKNIRKEYVKYFKKKTINFLT